MAAILVSFGFTFLIDRMTEVLTPDIYIELTGERMQERQTFRHIDVNTRLMKLSKYWNRQHKSLYRFMNIFEAKSMINRDENGGLIKFTKR